MRKLIQTAALLMTMLMNLNTTAAEEAASEITKIWDGTGWINYYKTTRVFVFDEDETCYTSEVHNWYWNTTNNIWVETARSYNTYNVQWQLTGRSGEYFDTDLDQWINQYIETYTYNGDGTQNTMLIQEYVEDQWVNLNQYTNTYSAGLLTNTLFELWDGVNTQWTNAQRMTYTYDGDDLLTNLFTETWNSDVMEWQNQYDQNYVNTDGMLASSILQAWQVGTEVWVNNNRHSYSYNIDNAVSYYLIESWAGTTSTWINQGNYTYTYNTDGQLSESVFQYFQPLDMVWVNSTQVIYTDYCINTSVEDTDAMHEVLLYPNPGNTLMVKGNNGSTPYTHASIYDAFGKMVFDGGVNANGQIMISDLSLLPDGYYSVLLRTNQLTIALPWIKE
ncbi:MAG: T9SS type A sorting domain-containing protein [Flavobacteriales bacterium]